MLRDKRGLSLTELIVTVALLSIVVALSFQGFSHLQGTYRRTELKWLTERQISFVMSTLEKNVRLAYAVTLSDELPDNASEMQMRIYQEGTGIYILNPKTAPEDAIRLNEASIALSVRIRLAVDDEGEPLKNALAVTVAPADSDNSAKPLSTVISLPNIQGGVSVSGAAGEEGFHALHIIHAGDYLYIPDMNDPVAAGCFIATAAYGEYDQSSVLLLRRLRDEVLLQSAPGREFVQLYYRISPPIAQTIAGNGALCLLTRVLLLPCIGIAAAVIHPGFALGVCAAFCLLYALLRRRFRKSGANAP